MQLIILAAGRGSRLKSVTKFKPKCMANVNKLPIIEYLTDKFYLFNEVIVITGYKSKVIENYFRNENIKFIKNKIFLYTNMVYSLFKSIKKIKEDVVIVYGDIIFDKKILINLKNKPGDVLPLNVNWLAFWKKRMPYNLIIKDAENIILKKSKVVSIGEKLEDKLPKMQFMGIIKLKKNTFLRMYRFFIKLKNDKIDFTNFLNSCLNNKILELNYYKEKLNWFEIDTKKDKSIVSKEIKKINFF